MLARVVGWRLTMAKITVRYLTVRPGAAGELPRYFWQPSSALREAGWKVERVPVDWAHHTDPAQLEAAAMARAQQLNEQLDQSRAAAGVTLAAPPVPTALRTLGDLVRHYQASEDFTRLAPSTQRGYRQCLLKLEDWAADAPVRAIDAVRIQRLKRGLSATPAFANAVVRVLRLLLAFGRREGWLLVNPAERPGTVAMTPAGLIWPRPAVDLFVSTADSMGYPSVGTAVALNEWLGQRQGDILRMPRAALRLGGSTLLVRQSKGGRGKAGVSLPIGMVPQLGERLAAELARLDARQAAQSAEAERTGLAYPLPPTTIIVSEETGRPYLADNFRHVFARIRAKAAERTASFPVDHLMPGRDMADPDAFTIRMEELTFMHLRHTAITRLAEAECDVGLITAISGHAQTTVQQLMERYMVRTAKMARLAFQRRIDAETPAAAPIADTVRGGGR